MRRSSLTFDTVELAEHIELLAWRQLAQYAERSDLGVSWIDHGGAGAIVSPGVESPLFNRVLGLGVDEAVSPSGIESLLAPFQRQGIRGFFVHQVPELTGDSTATLLAERGLTPFHRSWVKLVRGRQALPEQRPGVTTVVLDRRHRTTLGADFGCILAAGFGLNDAGAQAFSRVVGEPGWHAFMCLDAEEPMAAGLLFVADEVGHLVAASTLPGYRGRGAQAALVRARVECALERGCRLIVSETGEERPYEPQHSQRNLERYGFRVHHTRRNWCLPELNTRSTLPRGSQ